MIPLFVLIIVVLSAIIAMIRSYTIRRHLQSKHLIQVFDTHNNHIQLNESTSLTLEAYSDKKNPDRHTDKYLVSLIVDGEVIDTARIDIALYVFLTNHYPELRFNGPWHSLIVRQYIPFSKRYIKQMKQKKIVVDEHVKSVHYDLQEQFK